MTTRYEAPADPFDPERLPKYFDLAFSSCTTEAAAEARHWLVHTLRMFDAYIGEAHPGASVRVRSRKAEKEVETARIRAVKTLLCLYHLRSEYRSKHGGREFLAALDAEAERQAGSVDMRLQNFINCLGSAIFRAVDPEKALRLILLGKVAPGPKEKYEYRNFMIAADVEERKRRGGTLDAAYEAVQPRLSPRIGLDAIRAAYTKVMKEEPLAVKAELRLRADEAKRKARRARRQEESGSLKS